MFDEVRICALGSIDEAVLELHPGLTVLSGETGAGKSSVVKAFGLLAGGRADAGNIRSGRASCAVEARLTVDPAGPVAAQVREAGGELEGATLLVARTVSADGRSRAFVGGRAVPAGMLAELVGGMLALHGQSSQLQLRHPGAQRAVLDRFAGRPVLEPLAAFHEARELWAAARREQVELQALEGERLREIELLRLGLADVERVAPLPGEDLDLQRELDRLGAADELRYASETARASIAGDGDRAAADEGGALTALAFAARALEGAADSDPELQALAVRVHEIAVLTRELSGDLAAYAAGVDDDPQRLSIAQERRAELNRLCRPHNTGVDGVLQWADQAGRRLLSLDAGGERSSELDAIERQAAGKMLELAARLSVARAAAAARLQRRVTSELAALSMTSARLQVGLMSSLPPLESSGSTVSELAASLGVDGSDEVELLFSPGDGLAARPLARSASGGELSRVVLALEVVLAAGLGPASMIFDEVDAGIGGEAALEVGRRLALLGHSRQVICVTHLPQVAAFADRHLLVAKGGKRADLHSGVQVLDRPGRVRELSRMLAGVSDSELARGHAAELLEAAAASTAAAMNEGTSEAMKTVAGGAEIRPRRRGAPRRSALPTTRGSAPSRVALSSARSSG